MMNPCLDKNYLSLERSDSSMETSPAPDFDYVIANDTDTQWTVG